MKLLDKVKKRLEENYGIDFLSEFWTDDQIVLLEDIVEVTEKEVNNINYSRCCTELPTCYSTELDKIDQLKQNQSSTRYQLDILRVFANKLGLYDAADYLK